MNLIDLNSLLTPPKTIAIVGLSDKPNRPSFQVARYLQSKGFTIIPVNPNIKTFNGKKSYSSLSEIPTNIPIDIVDIFRKSDEVCAVVQEVIDSKRKSVIWMQEGVESVQSQKLANKHGLPILMNLCLMKQYQQHK